MADVYDRIESQTGFRIPDLYRRLVADGRTSYGATREEWKLTWRERSLNDPPALLIASMHVEWWSPEAIAAYEAPDYWLPEPRLVPFAQNGAGDVWCWHAASPGAEIVFAPQDENAAEVVAADLEGFLFRHMVLALSEIYADDGSDFTVEERVMSAQANVRVLAPYLAPERVTLLEELCARPLVHDAKWGCLRFLARDEAEAIVARELANPRLGETFEHMS
jgi:hypothetical protein